MTDFVQSSLWKEDIFIVWDASENASDTNAEDPDCSEEKGEKGKWMYLCNKADIENLSLIHI